MCVQGCLSSSTSFFLLNPVYKTGLPFPVEEGHSTWFTLELTWLFRCAPKFFWKLDGALKEESSWSMRFRFSCHVNDTEDGGVKSVRAIHPVRAVWGFVGVGEVGRSTDFSYQVIVWSRISCMISIHYLLLTVFARLEEVVWTIWKCFCQP